MVRCQDTFTIGNALQDFGKLRHPLRGMAPFGFCLAFPSNRTPLLKRFKEKSIPPQDCPNIDNHALRVNSSCAEGGPVMHLHVVSFLTPEMVFWQQVDKQAIQVLPRQTQKPSGGKERALLLLEG